MERREPAPCGAATGPAVDIDMEDLFASPPDPPRAAAATGWRGTARQFQAGRRPLQSTFEGVRLHRRGRAGGAVEDSGGPAGEYPFLSAPALQAQLDRCLDCADQPCRKACPVGCNPAYFISAARDGTPAGLRRAAAHVLQQSPVGGVCGAVCPDKFCMAACSRRLADGRAVEIPSVQATVVQNAREAGLVGEAAGPLDPFAAAPPRVRHPGSRVAVVGAGPSGLAAAAVLARRGFPVTVWEAAGRPGGVLHTIPPHRLPRGLLQADLRHATSPAALGEGFGLRLNSRVEDPAALLGEHAAVLVCGGAAAERSAGLERGERDLALRGLDLLWRPESHRQALAGGRVVVLGGGPVSVDCATTARRLGAAEVTLVYRRGQAEMPLSRDERRDLLRWDVDVAPRLRAASLERAADGSLTLGLRRVRMPPRGSAERWCRDVPGSECSWTGLAAVVVAVGLVPAAEPAGGAPAAGVLRAGDLALGASTVVEAAGHGKRAASCLADALERAPGGRLDRLPPASLAELRRRVSGAADGGPRGAARFCAAPALDPGTRPVPLDTDFFGGTFSMINPFVLSASPLTDGLEQVRRGYRAGWGGAVLKTAFDGVPVHIPGEYMDWRGRGTGFNADNVSGHSLRRVCEEIRTLRREWPDRLTVGSTGGSLTGDDERDRASWQRNTRLLDESGAVAVEYSLSCPQGGDGGEGSIASQSARLTAKIVDWVMQVSRPGVPKLFKLTGAVTSVAAVVAAVRDTLARHPGKLAGVTLANSFPSMVFRDLGRRDRRWDEGIVMGMSGAGVLPITYLALALATPLGVPVSGNGGVMSAEDAANVLALGAGTVQLCTLPTKSGVGVVRHLCDGLSQTLLLRGFGSVADLVGAALEGSGPVRDFDRLSGVKRVSSCDAELCISCGNCTRCPYGAIELDAAGLPRIDAAKCVGCSVCVLNCPAGALSMRARTRAEMDACEHGHL